MKITAELVDYISTLSRLRRGLELDVLTLEEEL